MTSTPEIKIGARIEARDGCTPELRGLVVDFGRDRWGAWFIVAFENGKEQRYSGPLRRDPKFDNPAAQPIGVWLQD